MSYGDFDVLKYKYIIEFTIITETPLSIRSGKSRVGPIDNPIVRIIKDGRNVPYIPGSSLKGVMRSEAEKYVRSTMPDEFVCDILNPEDKEYGELGRYEKQDNRYKPCVICRIFGGPTIASHVYVYDAYPEKDIYSTDIMRRVSISRISGGQMPGRLFEVEFVNPGSRFKTKMVVENIDLLSNSKEAKILNHVLKILLKGLASIGGMKSVGYGLIKIDALKVFKYWFEDGVLNEKEVTNELTNLLIGDI